MTNFVINAKNSALLLTDKEGGNINEKQSKLPFEKEKV